MTQPAIARIVAAVARGPGPERRFRALIRRSGVAISAAESWVLWHVGAHGPISPAALAGRLDADPTVVAELFAELGRRGYMRPDPQGLPDLTARGRRALVALVRAGSPPRRPVAQPPGRAPSTGRYSSASRSQWPRSAAAS